MTVACPSQTITNPPPAFRRARRSKTDAELVHASESILFHQEPALSYQGTRVLGGVLLTIALAILAASLRVTAARADVINLNPCNDAVLTQPFARWADPSRYELAPGGDFENSTWTLGAGAERAPGSEPYAATGSLGSWSLELPAGSSAQSPSTCVDAAYPSVRFFIAGPGAVSVSVVAGGIAIPAGVAVAGPGWQPTPVMITTSAVLAALSDGVAQVSFQVTSLSGDPRIDDVYIDPWCRG